MTKIYKDSIQEFKEAPLRLMVYRIAILFIIVMVLFRMSSGVQSNPAVMLVFVLLLGFAFYFRRRQSLAVFEDEIRMNIGLAFAISKHTPVVQSFSLKNLVKIETQTKKSALGGPKRKLLELKYKDGSSQVLNCTLFSNEDFDFVVNYAENKLPVSKNAKGEQEQLEEKKED